MSDGAPRPMHVLQVSPHLPPRFLGGVEVYTQHLMRNLAARGHRVQGVAVDAVAAGQADGCAASADRADGIDVHRLSLTIPASRPFHLLYDHPPTEAWFEQHLRASRPDVMHVQSGYLLGAPALAAARRPGTPVVLTLHDYWFACPRVTLLHPSGEICSGPEPPAKCAWCLTADRRRYRLVDALLLGRPSRPKIGRWRGERSSVGPPRQSTAAGRDSPTCWRRPGWCWRRPGSWPNRWPPSATQPSGCAPAATASRPCRAADSASVAPSGSHSSASWRRTRACTCWSRPCGRCLIGRSPSTSTVRSRPIPTTWRDTARLGRRRRAHQVPRPIPPGGAARAASGVRRRRRAVGLARGRGARDPGSPGRWRTGCRVGTGRIAGAHRRWHRRAAVRPGRIRAHSGASWRVCSTNRACWSGFEAAAPRPRTTDEEVEALLALYDDVRGS